MSEHLDIFSDWLYVGLKSKLFALINYFPKSGSYMKRTAAYYVLR